MSDVAGGREAIVRTLRCLASEALSTDVSELSLDAPLGELGADSLTLIELAMNVEDAFGIDIPREEYESLQTLGDALAMVERRLSGEPHARPSPRPLPAPRAAAPVYTPTRTAWTGRPRVVVTGIGAVTPLGLDVNTTFEALLAGVSGTARTDVVGEAYDVHIAAEVKGFDAAAVLGAKLTRRQGRFTQLACVAALEAVRDARLDEADYPRERIATLLGVGLGGIEHIEAGLELLRTEGPQRVSPHTLTALIPNMAAAELSILLRAFGPSFSVSSACASGGHALAQALDMLRAGRVDAVVSGGAEAGITPSAFASFARMGALSRRNHEPGAASRPFERDRDGFVLGEGAGILVLETLERARARGARIYAELAGASASADAYHHTQPDPEGRGAELAMRAALADAELAAEAVGYVNAHATGTPLGDRAETYALKRAFGAQARRLAVGGTKSMTGHLLGAAGAVEAIITALALARGVVPPTINLDQPDPECDLDHIREGARKLPLEAAISNTFGFGGQNATLVFKRLD